MTRTSLWLALAALGFPQYLLADCPPGSYTDYHSNTGCTPCSPGQFQPAPGEAGCSLCGHNQIAPDPGSTQCQPCPDGKFMLDTRHTHCDSCMPGKHAIAFERGIQCVPCVPGRFGTTGTAATINQPIDRACPVCNAGRYQHYYGATSCTVCPTGKWSGHAQHSCTACPTGRFRHGSSASSTVPAPLPATSVVHKVYSALTECEPCPPGRFAPRAGAGACQLCSIGRFSREGWSACDACGHGRTSIRGSSECTRGCGPGTYVVRNGARDEDKPLCAHCAPGRYSTLGLDQPRCKACPAGKHISGGGASSCIACPVGRSTGTYTTDVDECTVQCKPGSFGAGGAPCRPCANTTIAPAAAAGACTPCAVGFVANAAHTQCISCGKQGIADTITNKCFLCPRGRAVRDQIGEDGGTAQRVCAKVKLPPAHCVCDPDAALTYGGAFPRVVVRCRLLKGLHMPCVMPDGSLLHATREVGSFGLAVKKIYTIPCAQQFTEPSATETAAGTAGGGHSKDDDDVGWVEDSHSDGRRLTATSTPAKINRLPACPAPKRCRSRTVLSEWSRCSRPCGGGRKSRTRLHMYCSPSGTPVRGRQLTQAAPCNTAVCPCKSALDKAPGGARAAQRSHGGAIAQDNAISLAAHTKLWTVRKLREAKVALLALWTCPGLRQQLAVCHEPGGGVTPAIEQQLCGGLRALLVDCQSKTRKPCSRAREFPTWVLSSGVDAAPGQQEAWPGVQSWPQLQQIAMAAVQAQVRMVLMQQQLARQRAAETRERALKSIGWRRSAYSGAAASARSPRQQRPGDVLKYNVKPIDRSAMGDSDVDADIGK